MGIHSTLASMTPHMPIIASVPQLRTTVQRLWCVFRHYVEEARANETYDDVTAIAADETSSRRGHNYVTVVADTERKRATLGKDVVTLGRFTTDFHAHNGNSDAIRHVCMDMSPAYIAAATECFPNAAQTYDRFHVMKMANEALDAVRREDVRENPYLKGTRYLWLRHPDTLTAKQRVELAGLQQLNRKTARAYQLVITLRQFWEMPIERGEEYLRDFCSWAMRSRLESFKKLVRTIRDIGPGLRTTTRQRRQNRVHERYFSQQSVSS